MRTTTAANAMKMASGVRSQIGRPHDATVNVSRWTALVHVRAPPLLFEQQTHLQRGTRVKLYERIFTGICTKCERLPEQNSSARRCHNVS